MASDWAIITLDIRRQQNKTFTVMSRKTISEF